MKAYNSNGELVAEGYFIDMPFIPKGKYKETELDKEKRSVDFLITGCGSRYEIVFNKPVELKETRSVKRISVNAYLVTEKALEGLKKQYTCACDF